MTYFIAQVLVTMLDITGLIGYALAAFITKRYWVAVAIGVAWRTMTGLVLKLNIGLPSFVGAILATSVIFFLVRTLKNRGNEAKPSAQEH